MSGWVDVGTAAVTALAGGGLIKLVESWLSKSKYKTDQDKAFRDEKRVEADDLRKQIDALKKELKVAEDDLDVFKVKYWDIYTAYQTFQLTVYAILVKHNIDPIDIMPNKKGG